jgi:SSS family solute:Na+ symporter
VLSTVLSPLAVPGYDGRGRMNLQLDAHVTGFDLAVIAAYLAVMILIGFYVSRRLHSFDQFFSAGRAMTTPLLICTLVSTFYGVDVLFGTSELGYTDGIVAWFGYSRPMYLFLLAAAILLPPRLKRLEARTLPDVLANAYGRPTQLLGAAACFIYALPALGLFGLGRAFQVLFGWEPWVGALIFGSLALVYTLAGGLMADVLTDTVQFVMMCLSLAVALSVVMLDLGGFSNLESALAPHYFAPTGGLPVWVVLVYASTGLVVFVEPAFYQRIFAAESARSVRNALLLGIALWAAYDWCVTAAGMFAAAAVAGGVLPNTSPDQALLRLVVYVLPAGLTGLFLAGVLAAEMSTIDSYCLVAGGNLVYDIYRPVVRPQASDAELLRLTKIGIVLSWLVGFAVAVLFERLLALWVFTATLLSSTLLVPMVAALFWPGRKAPAAGLLSSAAGLGSSIAYYAVVYAAGEYDETYATHIWKLDLAGLQLSLWREYAMLVALPLSLLGFAIGNALDGSQARRRRLDAGDGERSRG